MKHWIALATFTTGMLFLPLRASGQFGVPAQKPEVDASGSLVVYPTLGLLHNGGGEETRFTDFSIMARARYSVFDDVSASAEFGGALGDFDDFVLGLGGKYLAVEHGEDMPVDVAVFSALDLGAGDATVLTWLSGGLVGRTLTVEGMDVTPYGGLGVGLTSMDPKDSGGRTEAAVGLILGGELALTEGFTVFTEFTIGPTAGMPILSWHSGVSIPMVKSVLHDKRTVTAR